VNSAKLRRYFWLVPFPLIGTAAFLNAQAVSQLVGTQLAVDAQELAHPTNVLARPATAAATGRSTDPTPILHRNAFDHVAGPLDNAPTSATDGTTTPDAPPNLDDPLSASPCEGIAVKAIAASEDAEWSFASIAGSDGKFHLVRRGAEAGGQTVHFIGWDRVWLTKGSALCQAALFGTKLPPPPPAGAPAPAASAGAPRKGAPALSADLKNGIQAISATEFNIDRGVVDKILENQADLMRQARIVPVQENGRVVGVRLNGVKADALLGVLGMQNGDVLRTINGFEMGDPQKALEAYARLRTADKLNIQVTRGGKNMNLDYNIK